MPTLHVVLTCTDRKTPSPALCVRSLAAGSLNSRFDAWKNAVASANTGAIPISQLYAGDHWQIVRSIERATPSGIAVQVWICSAGYGLLEMASPAQPYSATFASSHADSVAPPGASFTTRDWWQALGTWRPADILGPRTIVELVRSHPNDFVLVGVSGVYATAMSRDLADAYHVARENDRIAIISLGDRPADQVKAAVIHTDARLKAVLGGAMHSLNARVVRRAVESASYWFPERQALAALIKSWTDSAPALVTFNRRRLDDETVRAFITARLGEHPRATHTHTLRALRDGGSACEQARFATLFREVQSRTERMRSPSIAAPNDASSVRQ